MRMSRVIAAMAVLVVWGIVSPAAAQKVPSKPAPPPKVAPKGQAWVKAPAPDPVQELKEFQKMSPEERQKELAKLPPARRAHVEQQMAKLDSMTPEQRERMLNRLETMQRLSPDRRQAVNDEIQNVRALPTPLHRMSRLSSDEFGHEYSPEEQRVIRDTFPDKMNPDARERTDNYLEATRRLTPQRRAALNDEVQTVRALPTPADRRTYLYSDAFTKRFTPEEQRMIRRMFPVADAGPPRKEE
jgi:hypothetical protein